MNVVTYGAIDAAITGLGEIMQSVPADVRFDLRQELALKLATGKLRVEGLREAARNLVKNYLRDTANQRRIEQDYSRGEGRRYQVGSDWFPTWYAPHADAQEYAPFAMRDARVMHVKASQGSTNPTIFDAFVDFFDS